MLLKKGKNKHHFKKEAYKKIKFTLDQGVNEYKKVHLES